MPISLVCYQVNLRRYRQLLGLIVLCLIVFHPSAVMSKPQIVVDFSTVLAQPELFETGDLIFRKGNGLSSQFIDLMDEESPFSHVGIIQKEANNIMVIHAMPEETEVQGWVMKQSLADFLSDSSKIAVYRLETNYQHLTTSAVQQSADWVGVMPFDLEFSLDSVDALYCTEMIWLAYKNAGLDLVDNEFDKLDMPFMQQEIFLLPSRLANSRYLKEQFYYPENLQEKKS